MPFAFTDIEMIFNEDRHAVDWIFRYGNEKLAEVERVPPSGLIGNSFGNIFSNMDDKWLCTYERATLYGERLEIMAYSPEIDTELRLSVSRHFRDTADVCYSRWMRYTVHKNKMSCHRYGRITC